MGFAYNVQTKREINALLFGDNNVGKNVSETKERAELKRQIIGNKSGLEGE